MKKFIKVFIMVLPYMVMAGMLAMGVCFLLYGADHPIEVVNSDHCSALAFAWGVPAFLISGSWFMGKLFYWVSQLIKRIYGNTPR